MKSFPELLNDRKLLIADGAWGTELSKRGMQPGECPETWNRDHAADVLAVAASYVQAGSEIILSNTFGGNRFKLAKAGLEREVFELNRLGAAISKQAAAGKALVFASIGSTGEFMEPLGSITENEMVECFAEQIKGLIAGGADGFVIETMTDLGETKAAVRAAKENCSLPAVASLTFDRGQAGYATMMGVRPAQAASELDAAGADAVGANCGSGIANMVEIARLFRSATKLPLWIKPNAGLPELVGGKTIFRETPDEMAGHLRQLIEAGASIVGGCCGTTPDHIRAFVAERARLRLV